MVCPDRRDVQLSWDARARCADRSPQAGDHGRDRRRSDRLPGVRSRRHRARPAPGRDRRRTPRSPDTAERCGPGAHKCEPLLHHQRRIQRRHRSRTASETSPTTDSASCSSPTHHAPTGHGPTTLIDADRAHVRQPGPVAGAGGGFSLDRPPQHVPADPQMPRQRRDRRVIVGQRVGRPGDRRGSGRTRMSRVRLRRSCGRRSGW